VGGLGVEEEFVEGSDVKLVETAEVDAHTDRRKERLRLAAGNAAGIKSLGGRTGVSALLPRQLQFRADRNVLPPGSDSNSGQTGMSSLQDQMQIQGGQECPPSRITSTKERKCL
jgi:hypothetical protein